MEHVNAGMSMNSKQEKARVEHVYGGSTIGLRPEEAKSEQFNTFKTMQYE